MRILCVVDVGIIKLPEECFLRWQMVFVEPLEVANAFIRVDTLTYKEAQCVLRGFGELLHQLLEFLEASLVEVVGECLQAQSEVLEGVLEDQVLVELDA